MEYEQIKKLMEDMGESKLTDLSIEFPDGIKISMKKEGTVKKENVVKEVNYVPEEEKQAKDEESGEKKAEKELKKEEGNIVKSPMVGTFFAKPSPESEPYVKVGQNVKKGDILCIIEAMKLLNEIESEYDGKIEEILVEDGDMVDFEKPLFRIV